MSNVDYFAEFGLPRSFALDLAELERRYLERARTIHPDRLIGQDAAERARGAGQAIDLNRAYKALRRPASRAEHLLALAGVAIGDNEAVDPALLLEVLELREELEAAKLRGERAELERLEGAMRGRERTELDRVAAALAAAERAGDPDARRAALAEAKQACLTLRYVARYLEAASELDGEEDGG